MLKLFLSAAALVLLMSFLMLCVWIITRASLVTSVDFVKSSKEGSFALETFTMTGKILFTCFNDLVTTFAFDKKNCLCYNRSIFFYLLS